MKKYIIVIFLVFLTFLLYSSAIKEVPVGLDASGHLSKISYMQEHSSRWFSSWYYGMPLFQSYSPLYYHILNGITSLGFSDQLMNNVLAVFGIAIASVFIFLLVREYTKKDYLASLSALAFLGSRATQYYFVSVANNPFIFSIWVIPLGLFCLEKTLKHKNNFWRGVLYFVITISILLHTFNGLSLMLLLGIRILFEYKKPKEIIKNGLVLILPGVLLAGFWLTGFFYGANFSGNSDMGYAPSIENLLGFGDYIIWGKASGEVGIPLWIFIFMGILFWLKKQKFDKLLKFSFFGFIIFFLLTSGILLNHYPTGISPVRFIVPMIIIMSVVIGLGFRKFEKQFLSLAVIFLMVSLFTTYGLINDNIDNNAYWGEFGRFGVAKSMFSGETFPIKVNEFSNYRFGSGTFLVAGSFNYFYPSYSQTGGYYDQGVLWPNVYYWQRSIWENSNATDSKWLIDWMGIKYFEIGGEFNESNKKFEQDNNFTVVDYFENPEYSTVIWEYKNPKPIISVLRGKVVPVEEGEYLGYVKGLAKRNVRIEQEIPVVKMRGLEKVEKDFEVLNYSFERIDPDKITVYPKDVEENDILFVREFWHTGWKAYVTTKEGKAERPIYIMGPSFMGVLLPRKTEKIEMEFGYMDLDVIGIFLSFIGLVFVFLMFSKKKFINSLMRL